MYSKMYTGLLVKHPLFLSTFKETWICSTDLKKKTLKYQISRKSVQREPSRSMQRDGHDETNSHYSQFCKSAQKQQSKIWVENLNSNAGQKFK
jgi:hypothetical protein